VQKTCKMVVVELGAGIDIPTIRRTSEVQGSPVIRINTRHPQLPDGMGVSLPMGAKSAMNLIAAELRRIGWLAVEPSSNDPQLP